MMCGFILRIKSLGFLSIDEFRQALRKKLALTLRAAHFFKCISSVHGLFCGKKARACFARSPVLGYFDDA